MATDTLFRTRDERVLAGVCGGLAAHLGAPVSAVRVCFAVLTFIGGAGLLLYAWLWATVPWNSEAAAVVPLRTALLKPATPGAVGGVGASRFAGTVAGAAHAVGVDSATPEVSTADAAKSGATAAGANANAKKGTLSDLNALGVTDDGVDEAILAATRATEPRAPATAPPHSFAGQPISKPKKAQRQSWPIAELLLGTCLVIAGVALVLTQLGMQLRLELILPTMAVLVGVGLTWWQIADRDRPDRNQVPRVLGALALVAVGVLMFFVTASQPNALTVMAAAVAVLAGVTLAIAPWLLKINRELSEERAGRARELERAEIAAHLHDSVLQTLALIQQRAAPGSDIDRLARGQERELRDWLFRAADGATPETKQAIEHDLRFHAAQLEESYPVRFEIVTVGTTTRVDGTTPDEDLVPEALAAAAREAMLNAARHAGGAVTVYLELTPTTASVDVLDRGPGINLEALPDGRMGVRDSILGRMERAGGTARIGSGPGATGTSVRLAVPRATPRESSSSADFQTRLPAGQQPEGAA